MAGTNIRYWPKADIGDFMQAVSAYGQ